MGNNCGLLGDGGVDTSLLFFFLLLEMYALSDFLIMVFVMVSEAVT